MAWRQHVQRLVRPLGIVGEDERLDTLAGIIKRLTIVPPQTFFLEGSNPPLDHAVLLRCLGRDGLLPQTCASDDFLEGLCAKDQPVIRLTCPRSNDQAKLGCPP